MLKEIEIHGFCDESFEPLKEAFAKNFEEGLEVGASLAATVNGKFVIDVWSGFADPAQTRPWEKDTIVNVYSTTKFMTIICTLMCVDRGLLDLETPVAKYWPEFAQAGKEKIPVKHILSHMSGISGFETKITSKTLYDWDKIVDLLAAQEPWWEPGTKCGYHSITHGYLLGELVRRVSGKSLGTFFREEIAIPLNADFHIGLSEEHDPRVGELIPPQMDWEAFAGVDPNSVVMKTLTNPLLTAQEPTTREWRAAEIPAAGGMGNARSVARIAAALACGGELDGVTLLSEKTIDKALEEQIYDTDLVLQYPVRFGLGFGLNSKEIPLGSNPRTFFWGGWGGSLVVVDPDNHTSIGYVMNKMVAEPGVPTDPRTQRLGETFFEIVESL
ncbi:MAG: serine hydrolase domain-containing protein [Promethearchaeota archaeon]|jgi:CubicO group peptidase (beta-lactamase class C family)